MDNLAVPVSPSRGDEAEPSRRLNSLVQKDSRPHYGGLTAPLPLKPDRKSRAQRHPFRTPRPALAERDEQALEVIEGVSRH